MKIVPGTLMQSTYQHTLLARVDQEKNKGDVLWECVAYVSWLIACAEESKADWEHFGLTFCRETNEYAWGLSGGKIGIVISVARIAKEALSYLDDSGKIDIREMVIAISFKQEGKVDFVIAEEELFRDNKDCAIAH